MTADLLVRQLRFTRSEFMRCLAGLSPEDAVRRVLPMNCISWMVGHLAIPGTVFLGDGEPNTRSSIRNCTTWSGLANRPAPRLMRICWQVWREITAGADSYLDGLKDEMLTTYFEFDGKPVPENVGTLLLRNIYHYWFHTGEAHAVRQQLGHLDLPQFVGDISPAAVR